MDDLSGGEDYDEHWLYLSGGGMRAALGALGVLYFFYDGRWAGDGDGTDDPPREPVWNRITRLTSVSGGSVENAALANLRGELPSHFWSSFHRYVRFGNARYFPDSLRWIWLAGIPATLAIGGAEEWPLFGNWLVRAVLAGIAIGIVHRGIKDFGHEKIDALIDQPHTHIPPEDPLRRRREWLHIISVVDTNTGLPAYLLRRKDKQNRPRQVLALDRTAQSNRFDFYDASSLRLRRATFGSAAWPAVTVAGHEVLTDVTRSPWGRLGRRGPSPSEGRPARSRAGGADYDLGAFTLLDVFPADGTKQDGKQAFSFLDGGLASTLGSRLDPYASGPVEAPDRFTRPGLSQLHNTRGMSSVTGLVTQRPAHRRLGLMGRVQLDGTPAEHNRIRRVVVDAGDHNDPPGRSRWAEVPVISIVITTLRAIRASLTSQITLDRSLANNNLPHVWYLPTTGQGRHFDVRLRGETPTSTIHVPVDHPPPKRHSWYRRLWARLPVIGALFGLRFPEPAKSEAAVAGGTVELSEDDQLAVRFLDIFRGYADQVGTFTGLKTHGLAAAASGAANAFVEAQGIGKETMPELVALLSRMEQAFLQKGGLDQQLRDAGAYDLIPEPTGYRWPELDHLPIDHDARGFLVSHRGIEDLDHRDDDGNPDPINENTLRAFISAYQAGVRAMECDVQAVRTSRRRGDREMELIALHTWPFGCYRPKGKSWLSARPAWRHTAEQIEERLGYRPDRVAELVEAFSRIDPGVSWNFEAKLSRTMRRLINETRRLAPSPKPLVEGQDPHPQPFILSGGANRRSLLLARRSNPSFLTAANWTEMLRLILGMRANHVAVVQLPAMLVRIPGLGRLARRAATMADQKRIHVQWFGVNSKSVLQRIMRDPYDRSIGLITDDPVGLDRWLREMGAGADEAPVNVLAA